MLKRKPAKLAVPRLILSFLSLFTLSVMPQLTKAVDSTYEVTSHKFEFDSTSVKANAINRRPEVIIEKESLIDKNPQIRMNFWNGEVFLRLNMIEQRKQLSSDAIMHLIDSSKTQKVIYEPDTADLQQLYKKNDNCFEWEIILNKKPDTHIFQYQLETNGLTFYFQDSIDVADPYFEQPDSVRYSYAVYHSHKRNNRISINNNDTTYANYGTGKAFHLYRPRVWDSDGHTVWAKLSIDTIGHLLSINVADSFLNTASYPVTIDPTFGYTTAGASFSNPGNLSLQVNYTDEVLTGTAMLDSGFIHAKKLAALGNPMVKVNCYNKSPLFSTASLVSSTSQFEVTLTNFAWFGSPISGNLMDGVSYMSSFHSDDGFGGSLLRFSYDFADSSSVKVISLSDMTAPATLNGAAYSNLRYSCYITYVVNQSESPFRRRIKQLSEEIK